MRSNRKANLSRKAHAARPNGPAMTHAEPTSAARGPGVAPEVRHRLAECCAFFKAEHYRNAGPDDIRVSDVENAEAEIDAAIKKSGKRRDSA